MTHSEVDTSDVDGAASKSKKKKPLPKAIRRRMAAEAERVAEEEALQEERRRLLFTFLKTNAWLGTPAFTLIVAFYGEVSKEWGKVKNAERSSAILHFRELQVLAVQKLFDWLTSLPLEDVDRRIDLVRQSRVKHKYNFAAAFPKGEVGYADSQLTKIAEECFFFVTPETEVHVEEFLSRVGFTILAYQKAYDCKVRRINDRENDQTSVAVDFVHPVTRESLIGEGFQVVFTPLLGHPQRESMLSMIELFGKIK